MNIILNRYLKQGDAVKGHLILCHKGKFDIFETLENINYVFPEGKYDVVYEWSPRFRRKLWEFKGIPGRSEIKIHQGYLPKHSKGCILLRSSDISNFHNCLNNWQYIKVKIEVRESF